VLSENPGADLAPFGPLAELLDLQLDGTQATKAPYAVRQLRDAGTLVIIDGPEPETLFSPPPSEVSGTSR
jgi:hypothetical protein